MIENGGGLRRHEVFDIHLFAVDDGAFGEAGFAPSRSIHWPGRALSWPPCAGLSIQSIAALAINAAVAKTAPINVVSSRHF
jgi:hypothetical protein